MQYIQSGSHIVSDGWETGKSLMGNTLMILLFIGSICGSCIITIVLCLSSQPLCVVMFNCNKQYIPGSYWFLCRLSEGLPNVLDINHFFFFVFHNTNKTSTHQIWLYKTFSYSFFAVCLSGWNDSWSGRRPGGFADNIDQTHYIGSATRLWQRFVQQKKKKERHFQEYSYSYL